MTGLRGQLFADEGRPPPETSTRPEAATPAGSALGDRTGSFTSEETDLGQALPPDVAMLRVQERKSGPRSYELHFHYRGEFDSANSEEHLRRQQAHKDLALSRLDDDIGGAEWKEAFNQVKGWSGPQTKMHEWLDRLLPEESAQLIVFDVTNYELPWEMFYHEPEKRWESGPRGWLGALIPVSRWTSLDYSRRSWNFNAEPLQVTGGLVMMENEGLGDPRDRDFYSDYEVAQRAREVSGLVRLLATSTEGFPVFSLLMIRCHGQRTENNRLELDGIVLDDLAETRLPALEQHRAVVLLNACITAGTVTHNAKHRGAPTRSVTQTFLLAGAGGVIATLGYINTDHSQEFAVEFVKATEAGQNLASYLCDYRKSIAKRMLPEPGDLEERTVDDYREFFWSFMYVYYGHPHTTLKVLPRGR